jgi:hypothetical protein
VRYGRFSNQHSDRTSEQGTYSALRFGGSIRLISGQSLQGSNGQNKTCSHNSYQWFQNGRNNDGILRTVPPQAARMVMNVPRALSDRSGMFRWTLDECTLTFVVHSAYSRFIASCTCLLCDRCTASDVPFPCFRPCLTLFTCP